MANRFPKTGFSLTELMIAVLIIGILTAVALPRYFDHVKRTDDRAHQIKLMMVRDAIERYIIANDRELPPSGTETKFKTAIETYLPDSFPSVDLTGSNIPDDLARTGVSIVSSPTPIVGESRPTHAWKYNTETGRIIINIAQPTALDGATQYDSW